MKTVTFFIRGRPATAGSKRAFAVKKHGQYTGKVIMFGDNEREQDWKCSVAFDAIIAMKKAEIRKPFEGPVRLEIIFYLQHPKYHLDSAGEIRARFSNCLHISKPDSTKLLRCVEDALRSIVWRDDSQVCTTVVRKRYGLVTGAHVTIQEEIELGLIPAEVPVLPSPQQPTFAL